MIEQIKCEWHFDEPDRIYVAFENRVITVLNPHFESENKQIGNLIAAAPDLLEACDGLIELVGEIEDNALRKAYAKEIESAKNAIAKARGEG